MFATKNDPALAGTRLLATLAKEGYVKVTKLMVPRLPELSKPLATNNCNHDAINYGTVCWTLRKRMRTKPKRTSIATLTKKGATASGGSVARVHRAQVAHDLMVTRVILRYIRQGLNDVAREEHLDHYGFSNPKPDAFILPNRVIEIGGPSYSKQRVEELMTSFPEFVFELW